MKAHKLVKTIDQLILKNEIGKNINKTFFFLEYTNKNIASKTFKKFFVKKFIKDHLIINKVLKLNLFLNKFSTLQLFLNESNKKKTSLVYSQINSTYFNNFLFLRLFKNNLNIENKFLILLINKIILKF